MRKRGMAREQPFSCSGKEVKTDSVRACVRACERGCVCVGVCERACVCVGVGVGV